MFFFHFPLAHATGYVMLLSYSRLRQSGNSQPRTQVPTMFRLLKPFPPVLAALAAETGADAGTKMGH